MVEQKLINKIILATSNKDKIREITFILKDLSDLSIELVPVNSIVKNWSVKESGKTIAQNAILKALKCVELTNEWSIAEDTGLLVQELGGLPGVKSSRFAGENATYADNCKLLLEKLRNTKNRKASFLTIAVLASPQKEIFAASGEISGVILKKEKGLNGFGYDPVFKPDGSKKTFAKMTFEEKNAISHRAKAFSKLKELIIKLNEKPDRIDKDHDLLILDETVKDNYDFTS